MNITFATIVYSKHSADTILVRTDLPDPCFPYNGNLIMKFSCRQDRGVEYIQNHFPGVPFEHIKGEM